MFSENQGPMDSFTDDRPASARSMQVGEKRDIERDGESTDPGTIQVQDLTLVDWDGPDDPKNPLNWPTWRKLVCAGNLSFITFLTPLASSMIAPSIVEISESFGITNSYVASFVVTGYLLGYCTGPLIIAPLSELYGRQILYNVCNVIYLAFSIACAVAPNTGAMIAFRILAGIGGSCPLTLGAASIADMISPEKRGTAMALWVLGPLLGPTIGPIAGGYLGESIGWRWSFWILAISAGLVTIVTFFTMPESYAYILLERKAERLRKETGNYKLRSVLATDRTAKELFVFSIFRPLKLLFFSPIVFLMSIYLAIIYGYLYLLFTTFPRVFEGQYGFSTGSVGLTYIGLGVGSFLGLVATGATSDKLVQTLVKRNGGESKPEYRLPPMVIGAIIIPAALFWYGWTAEKHTHWIVPILGTGLLGVGMVLAMMATSTYIVDAFTTYAASAMAANTVVRSIVGAFLPFAGEPMYDALGLGWGNSLLGFIALALAPIPFVFYIFGERIRKSSWFKVEF